MDENRLKGAVTDVEGKIEEAVGGLAGDTRTKIAGKVDQGVGKIQGALGKAKDELGGTAAADRASAFVKQATTAGANVASAVEDAARRAGARASDIGERLYDESLRAGKSVGRVVEEQPLAAILVAAALGYGIAYLVHRRLR
jgi:uncharacterized protein YjbJ (UPF0337 family)